MKPIHSLALVAVAASAVAFTTPTTAYAQSHDMAGMSMPMPGPAVPRSRPSSKATKPPGGTRRPPRRAAASHAGRAARTEAPRSAHQGMPGMAMGGMAGANAMPAATDHAAMAGMAMPMGAMPGMDAVPAKGGDRDDMPGMTSSGGSGASSAGMTGMQGMDHAGMADPAMPMRGMPDMDSAGMPGMAEMPMSGMLPPGTVAPAGNAPAPAAPMDHYADRYFPAADMARARRQMDRESGGQTYSLALLNLAEYQVRDGQDGYRWDGEAWYGGDIHRATLKTEGDGSTRDGLDSAEVQALYSRAVGPYFNLQAGVRQDIRPTPARTYATVGFEGLAPYLFEVSGAAFLSHRGELLGRLEGYYDQRITQRLILQPRVELNLAARDIAETGVGAGLVNAEVGLRLRYEIKREFAPYVGVSWDRQTGNTARFARAAGRETTDRSVVAGLRVWF